MEVVLDSFQKNLAPFGGSVKLQRRNRETGETYDADSPEEIERANHQLRVSEIAKKLKNFTREEKLEWSLQQKHDGNKFFRNKQFDEAIVCYLDSIVGLDFNGDGPTSDSIIERMKSEVQLPVLTNLSACYLHLEKYHKVVNLCSEAIKLDSENNTARLRRSRGLIQLSEFDKAKEDLMYIRSRTSKGQLEYDQATRLLCELKAKKQQYADRMKVVKQSMESLWTTASVTPTPKKQGLYPDKELKSTQSDTMVRDVVPSIASDLSTDEDGPNSVWGVCYNIIVNITDCLFNRTRKSKEFKFE